MKWNDVIVFLKKDLSNLLFFSVNKLSKMQRHIYVSKQISLLKVKMVYNKTFQAKTCFLQTYVHREYDHNL